MYSNEKNQKNIEMNENFGQISLFMSVNHKIFTAIPIYCKARVHFIVLKKNPLFHTEKFTGNCDFTDLCRVHRNKNLINISGWPISKYAMHWSVP
jgi:hypothetical protein